MTTGDDIRQGIMDRTMAMMAGERSKQPAIVAMDDQQWEAHQRTRKLNYAVEDGELRYSLMVKKYNAKVLDLEHRLTVKILELDSVVAMFKGYMEGRKS